MLEQREKVTSMWTRSWRQAMRGQKSRRSINGQRREVVSSERHRPFDPEHGIYAEGYFREMLKLERRRSERSGDRFMLVLLDVRDLLGENTGREPVDRIGDALAARRLAEALGSCTRETDIRGWYRSEQVMGIIYTQINDCTPEVMLNKVHTAMRQALSAAQCEQVRVSFVTFPEDADHEGQVTSAIDAVLRRGHTDDGIAHKVSAMLKRSVDIAGSLIGIAIFSPFFLIIPVLIKLTSKGPVFFRQERVGFGGKTFMFMKFRSMHVNNDCGIHQKFVTDFIKGRTEEGECKIKDDPRVTGIGKFLRKTSLDELPQFFNVLMGDMSLVGPRPAIPYEVEEYDIWHKRRVYESKPGITGVWQVEGRSTTSFDAMVRMDIQYIKARSLMLDLKLLVKTPVAVMIAKGAY